MPPIRVGSPLANDKAEWSLDG
jgi:hypothetical protein